MVARAARRSAGSRSGRRQSPRDEPCYLSQVVRCVLQEPIREPDAVAHLVVLNTLLGELAEEICQKSIASHLTQPHDVGALLRQRIEVPSIPTVLIQPRAHFGLGQGRLAKARDVRRHCSNAGWVKQVVLVHAAREEGDTTVPLQVLALAVATTFAVE